MKTFIHDGKRVPYYSSGGNNPGDVVVLTSGASGRVGIVLDTIAAGATGTVQVVGSFTLPKHTGEAFTQGQLVYWSTSETAATGSSTGNTRLGWVEVAAGSAATSSDISLNYG